MLVLSFVSIFLAYFTWKYIETPMRHRDIVKPKNIFQMSIFGILFFCVIGLFGHKTEGFQDYILNGSELSIYKSIKRSSEDNCAGGISSCIKITNDINKKSILLLGDSNAYHFSKGLREIADDLDYSYVQLTKGGCMPLANFYRIDRPLVASQRCRNFNQNITDSIAKSENKIDVVVISSGWLPYYYGDRLFRELVNERDIPAISEVKISLNGIDEIPIQQRTEIFESYFNNIFSFLESNAKKVIVIGPMPPAVINFSKKEILKNQEVVSAKEFHSQSSELEDLLFKKSSDFSFSYIDIADLMCNLDSCRVTSEGLMLYGDSVHFSDFGQSHIMKPIFRITLNEFLINDE